MKKLIFLIFLWFIFNTAYADSINKDQINDYAEFGYTYKITNEQVEIDIDQDKILSSIPKLQSIGAINPDLNQTQINLNKVLYASLTGLYITTSSMLDIYSDPKVNNLNFKAYLLSPDDYGNNKKHLIYTFTFNKALNSKINWGNMTIGRFIKIAPGFKYSNWYFNNTPD